MFSIGVWNFFSQSGCFEFPNMDETELKLCEDLYGHLISTFSVFQKAIHDMDIDMVENYIAKAVEGGYLQAMLAYRGEYDYYFAPALTIAVSLLNHLDEREQSEENMTLRENIIRMICDAGPDFNLPDYYGEIAVDYDSNPTTSALIRDRMLSSSPVEVVIDSNYGVTVA